MEFEDGELAVGRAHVRVASRATTVAIRENGVSFMFGFVYVMLSHRQKLEEVRADFNLSCDGFLAMTCFVL
jgi:predicted phage tail protein